MIVNVIAPHDAAGRRQAQTVAGQLWRSGHAAVGPALSAPGGACDVIEAGWHLLAVCDAVVMAGAWEDDRQARELARSAELQGLPVLCVDSLPDHDSVPVRTACRALDVRQAAGRHYRRWATRHGLVGA